MSVLITMITVVMRRDALEAHYPELPQRGDMLSQFGWGGTYRADDHLAAGSFMSGDATDTFIDTLKEHGLRVSDEDGSFADLALLDAINGLGGARCDWLSVVWHDGHPVVHLAGTEPGRMALPNYMEPDRKNIEAELGVGQPL